MLTLAIACSASSGCIFFNGFLAVILDGSKFFVTTPLIPVSPYFSEMIEDTYHEEERYDKVPVLDPIEGENRWMIVGMRISISPCPPIRPDGFGT